MNFEAIANHLIGAGVSLLRGLLVLIVGLVLTRWAIKLFDRAERFSRIDKTLRGFLRTALKLVLYGTVVLTTSNTLGIPLTSIITLVASAGVAVSLAMQGALGNLVGGMTLLILKTVRAGEYVKIGDYEGTVKSVGAFYTDLTTMDNKRISLPNSTLTNTAVINYTREGTRRVDITYSVSYSSDIDRVYRALLGMMESNDAVLAEPAPTVVLERCADSSVDFTARAWVKPENYLSVYYAMTDAGKRALDEAGIEIPFPQMDVHIR